MISQTILRSTRASLTPARQAFARQASTVAKRPIQQPYRFPVPVEAYPMIGIVAGVSGFVVYSLSKHIYQDRDHLRWAPGAGGVKYREPTMTVLS